MLSNIFFGVSAVLGFSGLIATSPYVIAGLGTYALMTGIMSWGLGRIHR